MTSIGMVKSIKVLHVYKTSLPESIGGVESFIDTLCNKTAELGVENTVFSLSQNPLNTPIVFPKYKIIQAKQNLFLGSTGFSISAFSKFRKLASDANIIHYHFPNPFGDMLHFTSKIKRLTILTYHSDIIKQKGYLNLYKPLMQRFLKSVDSIIATSPNYLDSSKTLKTFRDKVKIIPIGIDKEAFPPLNPERLNYWKNKITRPFFLFIGAMRYYKGLHIALDAIKDSSHHLVLAGANGIESKLKAIAKKTQLHNVHFIGSISNEDKVALLHLCYGFIFPSHLRSEAFGISLLEASAYRKPMITCEIGTGTSYVNIHQQTGLVVEPSSPQALRQAMEYLMANPSRATEFGIHAEQRYKELFTAQKQAEAYLESYQNLLNR